MKVVCLCFAFAAFVLIPGCAQPEQRQASVMQLAPSVNRPADHHEWVKRLLSTPPLEGVQQASAVAGSRRAYPIALPAGSPAQYALVIDEGTQLAWLQTFGKTSGPWKLDHPDVAKLQKSVAILPTNAAMSQ